MLHLDPQNNFQIPAAPYSDSCICKYIYSPLTDFAQAIYQLILKIISCVCGVFKSKSSNNELDDVAEHAILEQVVETPPVATPIIAEPESPLPLADSPTTEPASPLVEPDSPFAEPVSPVQALHLSPEPEADDSSMNFQINPNVINFSPELSLYPRLSTDQEIETFHTDLFGFNGERIIDENDEDSFRTEISSNPFFLYPTTHPKQANRHRYIHIANSLKRLVSALLQLKAEALQDVTKQARYIALVKECVEEQLITPGCSDQKFARIEFCLLLVSMELFDMAPRERLSIMTSLTLIEYETNLLTQIINMNLPHNWAHDAACQRAVLERFDRDHGNKFPSRGFGSAFPAYRIPPYNNQRFVLNPQYQPVQNPNYFPYHDIDDFYTTCVLPKYNELYDPDNFLINADGPASNLSIYSNAKRLYLEVYKWYLEQYPNIDDRAIALTLMHESRKADYPDTDDADFHVHAGRFSEQAMIRFFKAHSIFIE